MHTANQQCEQVAVTCAVGLNGQGCGELGCGMGIAGSRTEFLDDLVEEFAGCRAGKGECNDALGLLGEVEQVDKAIGELVGFTGAGRGGNRDMFEGVQDEALNRMICDKIIF